MRAVALWGAVAAAVATAADAWCTRGAGVGMTAGFAAGLCFGLELVRITEAFVLEAFESRRKMLITSASLEA